MDGRDYLRSVEVELQALKGRLGTQLLWPLFEQTFLAVSRVAEDYNYGTCLVTDPRDFHPDEEVCSPEEIRNWHNACELASAGLPVDAPRHEWRRAGDVVMHADVDTWGIGTSVLRDQDMTKLKGRLLNSTDCRAALMDALPVLRAKCRDEQCYWQDEDLPHITRQIRRVLKKG